MNGRISKALRRQAERMTVGLPEKLLVFQQSQSTEYKLFFMKRSGTAIHHPKSTRSVYQKMKQVYKREHVSNKRVEVAHG